MPPAATPMNMTQSTTSQFGSLAGECGGFVGQPVATGGWLVNVGVGVGLHTIVGQAAE